MSFVSYAFFALFPIICILYYCYPVRYRDKLLLLISLCLYFTVGISATILLLVISVVSWFTAFFIAKNSNRRKIFAVIGAVILVLLLAFTKYGGSISLITSPVAFVGVSFFTFEALGYVADVYRGVIPAEKSYCRYLAFLTFFPTVTSGPIMRYKDFSESFDSYAGQKSVSYERVSSGLIYMLYGYAMKLVLAGRAGLLVDKVYGNYSSYSSVSVLLAVLLYSVQIYADFAGYSAIAIGAARILGFDIKENFAAPYLSRSAREFWSRWHISLSQWLRDYIYIPLGGNRKGTFRKYCNLLITFLISGAWHGSYLTFVVWGALHGMYQVMGDIAAPAKEKIRNALKINEDNLLLGIVQRVVTFLFVSFAWIFFRTSVRDTLGICRQLALGGVNPEVSLLTELEMAPVDIWILAIALIFMVVTDIGIHKGVKFDEFISHRSTLVRAVIIVLILLLILICGVYGGTYDASNFVYYKF